MTIFGPESSSAYSSKNLSAAPRQGHTCCILTGKSPIETGAEMDNISTGAKKTVVYVLLTRGPTASPESALRYGEEAAESEAGGGWMRQKCRASTPLRTVHS